MDVLHVAVAVVTDEHKHILITQRALHSSQGGLWEFPGGKLELGERPSDALIRELREEVGLSVQEHAYLDLITHSYSTRTVSLWVYHVPHYSGVARCCEAQLDLRWVSLNTLETYSLLAASQQVVELIRQHGLCD